MARNENICRALYEWACNEMGFSCDPSPTSDTPSMGRLSGTPRWDGICLGPMSDVWSYVIQHTKSNQSIDVIKGNLKLHSSTKTYHDNDEMKALVSRRNKLQQEVNLLENQNKKLFEQHVHNRAKFALRQKYYSETQSLLRDHKRSMFLLNILTNKMKRQISLLRDSSSASETKISNFIPSRMREGNDDRFRIDVGKMSKLMQDSLAELVLENPNLDKIQSLKQDVGLCLATLLTRIPHPHFLKLLLECQEADLNKISQLTGAGSDVDLHDLDLINQSINSVQEQLSSLSWFYVDQLNGSESKKKLAENLKLQSSVLSTTIQEQLKNTFQGREDLLKIASELIRLKVKCASYEATVEALKKISAELRERCTAIEANQDEVERAKELNEKNSRLVEHYSRLICTLAKKHTENIKLVECEVTELKRVIQNESPSLRGSLVSAAQTTRKSLENNQAFFYTFKPSKFFHTEIENVLIPVENLAANRLQFLNDSRVSDSSILKSLDTLSLNRTYSSAQIHRNIGEKSMATLRMRQTAKWHRSMMSEIAEKHKFSPLSEKSLQFSELVPTAKGKQISLEEVLLPALNSRIKKLEDASSFVSDIERAINEWIDEPAKLIDTETTVNGQTLVQWRENLTKALLSSNGDK